MRQTLTLLLAAAFVLNPLAYAQNLDPVDELIEEHLDPTCAAKDAAPIKKFTTFVNGQSFFKWEIRLLKQGHHFNFEICFDEKSQTDLRDGLPAEFSFEPGHSNPCKLASSNWLHIRGVETFKKNLKNVLQQSLEGLQTRQHRTEMTEKWMPLVNTANFMIDHLTEVVFPTTIYSLWFTGRLKPLLQKSMTARLGNAAIRTSKILAVLYTFFLVEKFASDDGDAEIKIKDEKGNVVTESTIAGRELEDVLQEISDETGLTPEQMPKLIQYVFEQLKVGIPEAMSRTSEQLGCIKRS